MLVLVLVSADWSSSLDDVAAMLPLSFGGDSNTDNVPFNFFVVVVVVVSDALPFSSVLSDESEILRFFGSFSSFFK